MSAVPMSHIPDYLAHRQRRDDLAPSSIDQIRRVLELWERNAGIDPARWTVDQVADWTHDHLYTANYRRSRLAKLRRYCRWLTDSGYLTVNPCTEIAPPRPPDRQPRDLNATDMAALAAVLPDDRARLIVSLMAQCGLRVGDVTRAQIDDIDTVRRRIHVRAKGGRGQPTHWVPIPDEAWRYIAPIVARHPSGPLVRCDRFAHHGPLTPNHIARLIRQWMAAAGIKHTARDGVSSHALRHTCAQDMMDRGATVDHVRHVLGHRTEATTRLYLRCDPPGLREAIEGRHYLQPKETRR